MQRPSDLRCAKTIIMLACTSAAISNCSAQAKPPSDLQTKTVQVEMKNIMYHFTPQIVVHIARLKGALAPTREDSIPIFDDTHSFKLAIDSAEISITTDAMANLLNHYVFAAKGAPLKDLNLTMQSNNLKVKGKLHSKDDVSFEVETSIDTTREGQIRLHAKKIRAAHLPVKGFMDLFGIELADLINTRKVAGVRTEGDDLILNPEEILPPPHIEGRVTQVRIEGDRIIQIFGAGSPRTTGAGNYMAYRGHQLRFGKLTMIDTDMILIDMDPRDPFDFYLDHYKDQLVAGYTKITPGFGLRVFMRDFNKLPKPGASQAVNH
jgi:hypothetical protein